MNKNKNYNNDNNDNVAVIVAMLLFALLVLSLVMLFCGESWGYQQPQQVKNQLLTDYTVLVNHQVPYMCKVLIRRGKGLIGATYFEQGGVWVFEFYRVVGGVSGVSDNNNTINKKQD